MSWFAGISQALSGGGFSMGEVETLEARRHLEDALRKSTSGVGSVGYQTAPGMASGQDLSPLLLQSIDDNLANATAYKDTDFVVWRDIPKDQAKQTLHEIRIHKSHGNRFLDMSVAEGNAGVNDFSEFSADSVQIKYWAARRELTYQAANMPSAGVLVSGSLLALQTKEAMTQLLRNIEIDILHGNSAMQSLKSDGLIKQIEDVSAFEDLVGGQLTFDAIERKLSDLSNVDVGGHPTDLYVVPNVWHDLSRQAQDGNGRFTMDGTISGRNFTFGASGLEVFSADSNRRIKVKKAPFLDVEKAYGSPFKTGTTEVDAYDPKSLAPTTGLVISTQPAAAVNASSKFLAADAGSYKYYIMGVNEFGHTAPVLSNAVTVAAGESVTIKITPPAKAAKYYMVFRTDKAATLSTAKYLFSVANNLNADNPQKVEIVDHNALRPKCSRALLVNFADTSELAFYRLLPLARIPLPQDELRIPFVLFMSGATKAKVPSKQWIWRNVGTAAPLS